MTGVNNKNMTIKLADMYIDRELGGDSDSDEIFFRTRGIWTWPVALMITKTRIMVWQKIRVQGE